MEDVEESEANQAGAAISVTGLSQIFGINSIRTVHSHFLNCSRQ
jgi:hypothetical protein